jgi:hypothetical protein
MLSEDILYLESLSCSSSGLTKPGLTACGDIIRAGAPSGSLSPAFPIFTLNHMQRLYFSKKLCTFQLQNLIDTRHDVEHRTLTLILILEMIKCNYIVYSKKDIWCL